MMARAWIPLLASLFLFSCGSPSVVKGFVWKAEGGEALAFSQSASWPEGEEGSFSASRRSNRYSLLQDRPAPAGSALMVSLRRGAGRPESRVKLILGSGAKSGASLEASFPLLSESVEISLPLKPGSRIGSLALSAEGGQEFSIESLSIGPGIRGIDGSESRLRVSSGFALLLDGPFQELTVERPFAGLTARKEASRREGLLLDYGPSPQGAVFRLEAVDAEGKTRAFNLRSHPGGARSVLDTGLFPSDTAAIRLRAPSSVKVRAFFAGELSREDFELADLGRVLLSRDEPAPYFVYRWDLLPSVLVFDFKDYATQDAYLKRLAFFVEKLGFRGRLARDEELAGLHGWNAHDYRAEDLAAFFSAARKRNFPLGREELDLESILLRQGIIADAGSAFEAGRGAMISMARESGEALRHLFAVHESTHAIFFCDAEYRAFARGLWSSLDRREKWFWTTYFAWSGYDVGSDYLMGNEFQAYLLQQPTAAAEDYFTKRKSAEFLEKHPEQGEAVAAYMAEFSGRFAQHARELELWLYRRYGIEAGRTLFLGAAKN